MRESLHPGRLAIRDAGPGDVGLILRFVRELASFEREPDAVHASEADFLRDGFGPNPVFWVRLAHLGDTPAGFALYHLNYSTWEGRAGIHLEDLFVTPSARRHGVGRALVADVAAIAQGRSARRLDLAVLTWNEARDFYRRLGFEERDGWLGCRLSGDALAALARVPDQSPS